MWQREGAQISGKPKKIFRKQSFLRDMVSFRPIFSACSGQIFMKLGNRHLPVGALAYMQGEGPSSHFAKKAALQPFCMLQLLVNKTLQLWDKMLLKVVVKMWQNIKATLMGKLSTFSPFHFPMLISNLNFRFAIPFRTNLAKYQPIRTDMGARAAILAFRSLNKLSTLVAD